MFNLKVILSVSIIIATTSPAMAFNNSLHKQDSKQNVIYISNNDKLDDNAKRFISEIADKGIGIIDNAKISDEARKKQFRDLLRKNFDMKTIARFALGRYWRTTPKAEQKEYLKLFENMIVDVYSKRFGEYSGLKLEVVDARETGKSDAIVSSVIIPKSGQKIDVDWRVRKKKNGDLKVIDVMIEGVSMSLTQRSDFASVIQRGGGKTEVLLAYLRPKNKDNGKN